MRKKTTTTTNRPSKLLETTWCLLEKLDTVMTSSAASQFTVRDIRPVLDKLSDIHAHVFTVLSRIAADKDIEIEIKQARPQRRLSKKGK